MELKVNGELKQYSESNLPLSEVLKRSGVENLDLVSVQLNGEFVAAQDLTSTDAKNGDEVDFLFFMGGGAL